MGYSSANSKCCSTISPVRRVYLARFLIFPTFSDGLSTIGSANINVRDYIDTNGHTTNLTDVDVNLFDVNDVTIGTLRLNLVHQHLHRSVV